LLNSTYENRLRIDKFEHKVNNLLKGLFQNCLKYLILEWVFGVVAKSTKDKIPVRKIGSSNAVNKF
jgi:hypothetical protein